MLPINNFRAAMLLRLLDTGSEAGAPDGDAPKELVPLALDVQSVDDCKVREALVDKLRSEGYRVVTRAPSERLLVTESSTPSMTHLIKAMEKRAEALTVLDDHEPVMWRRVNASAPYGKKRKRGR